MIIALYGPPGAGKSTIVKAALRRGVFAYDAEKFGASYEKRKEVLTSILPELADKGVVIIGAADLTPEDFSEDTKFVLLLPPLEIYKKRLAERAATDPGKQNQSGVEYKYEGFAEWRKREPFDLGILEEMTVEETLDRILTVRL